MNDIDIVVAMRAADADRVRAAFDGPDVYVPPPEVIAIEAARPLYGPFDVIHAPTALKAGAYPAGTDPLHAWALPLVRRIQVGGHTVAVAPPESVIVRKLQYLRDGGSDKHQRDVRAILAQHGAALDREALGARMAQLGLQVEWARVANG